MSRSLTRSGPPGTFLSPDGVRDRDPDADPDVDLDPDLRRLPLDGVPLRRLLAMSFPDYHTSALRIKKTVWSARAAVGIQIAFIANLECVSRARRERGSRLGADAEGVGEGGLLAGAPSPR
jgi:hypothetical protein